MKETGLMFKAPLVRAILSGQKTQTRRALSAHTIKLLKATALAGEISNFLDEDRLQPSDLGYVLAHSPAGMLRDRIYVRETWQHANFPLGPYLEGAPVFYRADYLHESDPDYADAERTIRRNWLPSIHMPKAAARIWLEITGVRVERLQSISEQDAIAEGIERTEDFFGCPCWRDYSEPEGPDAAVCPDDPIGSFQTLWESTGGDWAENPWVWVIDFKTISTTGRPA